MPLSDLAARNARPGPKPVKLTDADGMYLLVKPDGARYWRFDYRYLGKRGTLALGVYPDVSLAKAREKRDAARKLIAEGKNPAAERKRDRMVAHINEANSFHAIAEEWLQKKVRDEGRAAITVEKTEWLLGYLYPKIGSMPIKDIRAVELLAVLQEIEARGLNETAKRMRSTLGRIFRYAIVTGRAERNPAADLAGALTVVKVKHHAALFEPHEIAGLLRSIDGYRGDVQVRAALKLIAMLFTRPGELRHAVWSEFDLVKAEWRIPLERMKMRLPHIVPLPRQAVEILRELRKVTGNAPFMFSSFRTPQRPMSENTLNAALRRLGYTNDEMTSHGFRRTASTRLNEMGWNRDWVERQLSHIDPNQVRSAYNAAEYLPDRRRMMQAWADYLDELRAKPLANLDADDLALIG